MEVLVKAVKFKYYRDFSELFKDFKKIIEFCIDKALELGITSYAKLKESYLRRVETKMVSEVSHPLLSFSLQNSYGNLKELQKEEKKRTN